VRFTLNDQSSGSGNSNRADLNVTNITYSAWTYTAATTSTTTITAPGVSWANAAAATGTIVTNDNLGTEGALVTMVNATIIAATGTTTVDGVYGTLTIAANGTYTYTPDAGDLPNGVSDVFTYRLTQPDGDTASATLTVNIADYTYASTSAGDAIVGGAGVDSLSGGAGNDYLDGGAGNDTLNGDADSDHLLGGEGNDVLNGGIGMDFLEGGAGDDILSGGDGNDYLSGGDGHDNLDGGAGNDVLDGGAGNDTMHGGADNDVLTGGAGNDVLFGDTGNDTFVINRADLTGSGGTRYTDTIKDFGPGDVLDLSDVVDFYAGNTSTPASSEIQLVNAGNNVNVNSVDTGQTIAVIESDSVANLVLDQDGNITAKS